MSSFLCWLKEIAVDRIRIAEHLETVLCCEKEFNLVPNDR